MLHCPDGAVDDRLLTLSAQPTSNIEFQFYLLLIAWLSLYRKNFKIVKVFLVVYSDHPIDEGLPLEPKAFRWRSSIDHLKRGHQNGGSTRGSVKGIIGHRSAFSECGPWTPSESHDVS